MDLLILSNSLQNDRPQRRLERRSLQDNQSEQGAELWPAGFVKGSVAKKKTKLICFKGQQKGTNNF